jgi:hypothetical protein
MFFPSMEMAANFRLMRSSAMSPLRVYKHGRYTAESIKRGRQTAELIRMALLLTDKI